MTSSERLVLRAAAGELRTGVSWCDGTSGPLARLLDALADSDDVGVRVAALEISAQLVLDDSELTT